MVEVSFALHHFLNSSCMQVICKVMPMWKQLCLSRVLLIGFMMDK